MPPAAVSDLDKEAPVAASAHLLLTALSGHGTEPSLPGPRAGRASAEPEGAHLCPLGSEGTCSEAPLTSEPPLADAAHLTSEPTSAGAASGA